LAALDDKLTAEDLDGIIEEVDEDGSGTVDFEGNLNYINELIFSMIK
jgi:Ca2+-binding EF-hand superfamily protein